MHIHKGTACHRGASRSDCLYHTEFFRWVYFNYPHFGVLSAFPHVLRFTFCVEYEYCSLEEDGTRMAIRTWDYTLSPPKLVATAYGTTKNHTWKEFSIDKDYHPREHGMPFLTESCLRAASGKLAVRKLTTNDYFSLRYSISRFSYPLTTDHIQGVIPRLIINPVFHTRGYFLDSLLQFRLLWFGLLTLMLILK